MYLDYSLLSVLSFYLIPPDVTLLFHNPFHRSNAWNRSGHRHSRCHRRQLRTYVRSIQHFHRPQSRCVHEHVYVNVMLHQSNHVFVWCLTDYLFIFVICCILNLHLPMLIVLCSSSTYFPSLSSPLFHFPFASIGSTYVSLKSAILPSLSIARLDVILQHHFIFELKDMQSDRNLGPSSVRGTLGRVYSDREAILNPAELAEREAFLGSRPGTYICALCVHTPRW